MINQLVQEAMDQIKIGGDNGERFTFKHRDLAAVRKALMINNPGQRMQTKSISTGEDSIHLNDLYQQEFPVIGGCVDLEVTATRCGSVCRSKIRFDTRTRTAEVLQSQVVPE